MLQQVEANQVATDTLYTQVEMVDAVANSAAARRLVETWVYRDPVSGTRKAKFRAHGKINLMYRIDLDTYELEFLTADGKIQRTKRSPKEQAYLSEIFAKLRPEARGLSETADLLPEKDRDDTSLGEPILSAGSEDSVPLATLAGDAEFLPKKGKGLFKKDKKLRYQRGHFKRWSGKRVRALKVKGPKDGAGWQEKDVDLGNGLVVATRRYGKGGELIQEDRVVKLRRLEDGRVEAEETETEIKDVMGGKKVKRIRVLRSERNRAFKPEELELKLVASKRNEP